MTEESPKLLNVEETAALLGVTPQTSNGWRCSGRYALPYVKCGHLVRYKLDDVLRFIEQRTVKLTTP